jgi:hypothetical protein
LSKFTQSFYCLLAALFVSTATQAQATDTADSSRWYQIEVFIYANNKPSAANEEFWPTELGLKYPERLVELTEIDEQALEREQTERSTEDTTINSGPDLLNYQQEDLAAATTIPRPTPFLVLDEQEMQLKPVANKVLRQADFRLLFHKAWRQDLNDRETSEHIIIFGGERFDQHYELEGTINISVERYLHFSTDLWFSTFTSNVGGEENPWPVLPPIPLTSTPAQAATDTAAQDPFSSPVSTYKHSLGNEFQALTGNQYSVERTVSLKQRRRMRSNELHYIDHPLLGLLVKITPFELTEPGKKPAATAEQ